MIESDKNLNFEFDINDFACNLKYLREKYGLTQEQLANKLQISSSTVGMYEQGRRQPDLATLVKISNTLYTPINILLGIEDKFRIKSAQIDKAIVDLIEFIKEQDIFIFKGKKLNNDEVNHILYVLKLLLK